MKSIIAQIKTVRHSTFKFATALRHSPKTQYHTVSFIANACITGSLICQGKAISESTATIRLLASIALPTVGICAVNDLAKLTQSVEEYHREQSKVETTETN